MSLRWEPNGLDIEARQLAPLNGRSRAIYKVDDDGMLMG